MAEMANTRRLHSGSTKNQTRREAINEYLILRLRNEEFNHLDYLLVGLAHKRITLPEDSPFSTRDLANTVRTCFLGWLATLTDKDDRAVYPFNCLFTLFPNRRIEIGRVQRTLEWCHGELHAFRGNVAFHALSSIAAHFEIRDRLQEPDSKLDLHIAVREFNL